MTPAEFQVLLDARVKHVYDGYDFADTINAQMCRVTAHMPDVELAVFKLLRMKEQEEQPADNGINAFKAWVSATGGETI